MYGVSYSFLQDMTIEFSDLRDAVSQGAAFRRIRTLQPVGGQGDKIFPPTYPGERNNDPPRHVFERRRIEGEDVWCVLVDSVQSQANRMEEALLAAAEEGSVQIPYVTVDFSAAELEPLERITSLDAPHRVYDAILRDSLLKETPFMQSEEGKRLASAKPADATALLEISPTALVFGAWHSQGSGGGLGAKFPRTLVSEIMAIRTPVEIPVDQRASRINARTFTVEGFPGTLKLFVDQQTGKIDAQTSARRTGSRIDPLGASKTVKIYRSAEEETDWTPWEDRAARKSGKPVLFKRKNSKNVGKPATINHGNIPPTIEPLGVTCDYAEHRFTITLAGIRRLHFGSSERDIVGRALIASLGLLAMTEQDRYGYALRSRCDLVCEGTASLELVRWDGSAKVIEFDCNSARALYKEAYEQAKNAGFNFRSLTLQPQDKLVEIVRQSRELALGGQGEEEDDNDS